MRSTLPSRLPASLRPGPRRLPVVSVLLAGLVFACGGDGDPTSADVAPYPGPESRAASRSGRPHALGPGTHLGLDVSHHSGEIDWQAVADQGYDFVFIKASEGVDDPDPKFHEHWRRAAKVGLARGAYHFYVTEDDPEAQADLFFSTVDLRPGDLVPVVDIEVLGKGTQQVELPEELRRFLDILETRTGVTPILYTPPHFWDSHIHESFSRYPLWVAEYGVKAPELPEGWAGWVIWQFEGDAEVPGIEKGADRSRTHPEVDLDALRIPFRLR